MACVHGFHASDTWRDSLRSFRPTETWGLWFAPTDAFGKVIDLIQLHGVGNPVSVSEISRFSQLPAEEDDLIDADAPLRGLAIYLIDELLHRTNRREYAGLLRSLLTSG